MRKLIPRTFFGKGVSFLLNFYLSISSLHNKINSKYIPYNKGGYHEVYT